VCACVCVCVCMCVCVCVCVHVCVYVHVCVMCMYKCVAYVSAFCRWCTVWRCSCNRRNCATANFWLNVGSVAIRNHALPSVMVLEPHLIYLTTVPLAAKVYFDNYSDPLPLLHVHVCRSNLIGVKQLLVTAWASKTSCTITCTLISLSHQASNVHTRGQCW